MQNKNIKTYDKQKSFLNLYVSNGGGEKEILKVVKKILNEKKYTENLIQ